MFFQALENLLHSLMCLPLLVSYLRFKGGMQEGAVVSGYRKGRCENEKGHVRGHVILKLAGPNVEGEEERK